MSPNGNLIISVLITVSHIDSQRRATPEKSSMSFFTLEIYFSGSVFNGFSVEEDSLEALESRENSPEKFYIINLFDA